MPPEPREMVAYYTAHKLRLGWGYLFFVAVRRAQGLGLLRGLPMHFLQSAMEPSEPKGKNRRKRTVESSQEAFVVRQGPNGRPCSEVH